MSAPLRTSAVEQAALVRSGTISARELVDAALLARDELDGDLNAFVASCDERARAEADTIRAGDPRALCGVPIALKDLVSAVEGLPTTHGSRAFGDWRPTHDSAHVRRLREAGAIVDRADEHARARAAAGDRERAVRGDAQPLGPFALARRLLGWQRRRRRGRDRRARRRLRPRRLDPHPRRVLRARRPQAEPRARVDRPGLRRRRPKASSPTACSPAPSRTPPSHSTPSPGRSRVTTSASPPPAKPFAASIRGPLAPTTVHVAFTAPLGAPVDSEPRAAAEHAARALADIGHHVVERAPDWDDDGLPRRLGALRARHAPAPAARARTSARPPGRPRTARARDPGLDRRRRAGQRRRPPRSRRAHCGRSPAASCAHGRTAACSSRPHSPACPSRPAACTPSPASPTTRRASACSSASGTSRDNPRSPSRSTRLPTVSRSACRSSARPGATTSCSRSPHNSRHTVGLAPATRVVEPRPMAEA